MHKPSKFGERAKWQLFLWLTLEFLLPARTLTIEQSSQLAARRPTPLPVQPIAPRSEFRTRLAVPIDGKRFFSWEGSYMKGSIVGLAGFIALFVQAGPARQAGFWITNGGFETGTFSGWTVADEAGGNGTWYVSNSTSSPNSGHLTVGPASGSYYAVSDQSAPGAHVLIQSFSTVPANSTVTLTFDMFVNNYDTGPFIGPLDHNSRRSNRPGPGGHPHRRSVGFLIRDRVSSGTCTMRASMAAPQTAGRRPDPYIHYKPSTSRLMWDKGERSSFASVNPTIRDM